jgi:hypothetical protein
MYYLIVFAVGSTFGYKVGMWFTKKVTKGALQMLFAVATNAPNSHEVLVTGIASMCEAQARPGSMTERVEIKGAEVYKESCLSFHL